MKFHDGFISSAISSEIELLTQLCTFITDFTIGPLDGIAGKIVHKIMFFIRIRLAIS